MKILARLILALCFVAAPALANDGKFNIGDVPYPKLGKSIKGGRIDLNDMKGKIVVLTFWASWCGPCLEELPVLHNIQKQVSPDNLQVIAVNAHDNRRAIRYIADQLEDTDIIFTEDSSNRSRRRYGVEGIPYLLILNRDGTIVRKHVGYGSGSAKRLVSELNALLNPPRRTLFDKDGNRNSGG